MSVTNYGTIGVVSSCFTNNSISNGNGTVFVQEGGSLILNEDNYISKVNSTLGEECGGIFRETSGNCLTEDGKCVGECDLFDANVCGGQSTESPPTTAPPGEGGGDTPRGEISSAISFGKARYASSGQFISCIVIAAAVLVLGGLVIYRLHAVSISGEPFLKRRSNSRQQHFESKVASLREFEDDPDDNMRGDDMNYMS